MCATAEEDFLPIAMDELLISITLDGKFHAFSLRSGEHLWTVGDSNGPLVSSQVPGGLGSAKNQYFPVLYIPEISRDGGLYVYSKGQLTSLGTSLAQVVAQCPLETPEGALYVGSKESRLLSIALGPPNARVKYDGAQLTNLKESASHALSAANASAALDGPKDLTNPDSSHDGIVLIRTDYRLLVYHMGKPNFYYNVSLAQFTVPKRQEQPFNVTNLHVSINGLLAFETLERSQRVHQLSAPVSQVFAVYPSDKSGPEVVEVQPERLPQCKDDRCPGDAEAYIGAVDDGLYALPASLYALANDGDETVEGDEKSILGTRQLVLPLQSFYERHGYLAHGLLPQGRNGALLITDGSNLASTPPLPHYVVVSWTLLLVVATLFSLFRRYIRPLRPEPKKTVSPLKVGERVLGLGSNGTVVYHGSFQNRPVAIKRVLLEHVNVASNEIALLQQVDRHPNVIRYFWTEMSEHFCYIALEECSGSLVDYVENVRADMGAQLPLPKQMCFQIASGLAHLHSLKLVHRDLKPHNVLVTGGDVGELKLVLSDLGLSKKLGDSHSSLGTVVTSSSQVGAVGTTGWRAPEALASGAGRTKVSFASDLFSLGCVWYYILTGGKHPFGESMERDSRILEGRFDLSLLQVELDPSKFQIAHGGRRYIPPHLRYKEFVAKRSEIYAQQPHRLSAEDLVLVVSLLENMLRVEPAKRISSVERVLQTPWFWRRHERLSFLQDVSDRYEVETKGSALCRVLETSETVSPINGDWMKCVDFELIEDLTKYRRYYGDSIRDLLRVIRNKKHHYGELPLETQKLLGSLPDGFYDYFSDRFPRLLLHTYCLVSNNGELSREDQFKVYISKETQK